MASVEAPDTRHKTASAGIIGARELTTAPVHYSTAEMAADFALPVLDSLAKSIPTAEVRVLPSFTYSLKIYSRDEET